MEQLWRTGQLQAAHGREGPLHCGSPAEQVDCVPAFLDGTVMERGVECPRCAGSDVQALGLYGERLVVHARLFRAPFVFSCILIDFVQPPFCRLFAGPNSLLSNRITLHYNIAFDHLNSKPHPACLLCVLLCVPPHVTAHTSRSTFPLPSHTLAPSHKTPTNIHYTHIHVHDLLSLLSSSLPTVLSSSPPTVLSSSRPTLPRWPRSHPSRRRPATAPTPTTG